MTIFVTGHSIISAIGTKTAEVHQNLKSEISGIKSMTVDGIGECNLALVSTTNEELKEKYTIKGDYSRTALLGIASLKNLINNCSLNSNKSLKTGFISGTSVGGIDATEQEYLKHLRGQEYNKEQFLNHSSGTVTDQIARETFPFDITNTISTACSSASNAILLAAKMMRMGLIDRAVVGGSDSLSNFTINGFKSLMIYDQNLCCPFDKNRKGLNLGEGAGYLLLETEKSITQTQNQPLALLSGWCNASDAYHQTASSPSGEGAQLAMQGALKMAQLKAEDISYINAHGTGTQNNDLSESTAIKAVFGNSTPDFSSTKSYTGHTLAASGGIESGIAIMALNKGCLYPNLHFKTKIKETGLTPILTYSEGKAMQHILSNAFGFGGNSTSLIFSKI